MGGPIGLLHGGDIIEIDAVAGTLNARPTDAELAERKTKWNPRETNHKSRALWKYAQQVGPAVAGAVTHPGRAREEVLCGHLSVNRSMATSGRSSDGTPGLQGERLRGLVGAAMLDDHAGFGMPRQRRARKFMHPGNKGHRIRATARICLEEQASVSAANAYP